MDSNELLDSVNRQIALVGAEVRDGSVVRQTEPFPQAFITAEKEQFVFLDRPAQNTAELIALESGNGLVRLVEVVLGIECAVAEEFKPRTMQCVGSGIGHHVHHTARNQTVLGAVVICGDREFANGINSQIGSRRAARRLARIVTHILSIHEERILSGLRSGNAHF